MPYTMEDFLSASSASTTTIQARRSRPNNLTVTPPGRLQLPVAPPSPLWDDMDTNTDPEPFPDFVDICPPVKAEPLHCVLHCPDDVCERLVSYGRKVPPCRCGDEVFQPEPLASTPVVPAPEVSLDKTIFAIIGNITLKPETIEIRRPDVRNLLAPLQALVASRALADEDFMSTMRDHRPQQTDRAARSVVGCAFSLISLYFDRTMRYNDRRYIAPQNLHAELKMYLSTGLREWVEKYSNNWEHDVILDNVRDPRTFLEGADFGFADAVSKVWTECLEDVVRLFIWHDAEIQRRKLMVDAVMDWGTSWMSSIIASMLRLCG
jgi:hypothetical protein